MNEEINELLHQNRQLKKLVELSVTLNSTLDLDDILQLLTGAATEMLDCEGASILLYDERQERLYFAAATGSDPKILAEIPVPLDASLAGTIFKTNQPIIMEDAQNDPRHYLQSSEHVSVKVRSLVGVPMLIKDRVIGVLEGVNKIGGSFTKSDETLLSVTASHAAIAINNARLLADAERRAQNLEALRDINNSVLNNLDLQLILPQILTHIQERLGVDATDVLLLDNHSHILTFAAGRGFRTPAFRNIHMRIGEGNAGRVALERKVAAIPNMYSSADATVVRSRIFKGENFIAYHAAPLIVKGEVKGVLEVFHRSIFTADEDWLAFFQAFALQTAIAIDSASLFADLQRSNSDLRLAYDATIEGWSRALDLRDKETEGHTQRVTALTVRLARAFSVNEEDIVHIRRGALLHDMGKMGVRDSILLKPDKLTDAEWSEMRMHPQYAFEMLAPIVYLKPALDIPYCHHEKWDGTGYPRGLKGREIPFAARMFAVVDVWDALSYNRPYRNAWDKEKTLEYIKSQSGKHFDSDVVDVFLSVIE